MAAALAAVDWESTPIGPPEAWPQSLRTALSICLESRFPILIWWGPELVMLYNDAYRAILGAKHPASLAMRGRECWPEIWDIIGPMLASVLVEGRATWSEDQILVLRRNGFPEECYFTFSYSPIRDEMAGVGGIFTAVTETTAAVVGERRLRTLRALAVDADTTDQAVLRVFEVLAAAQHDVPFALMYGCEDGGPARLVARAGVGDGADGSFALGSPAPPHIDEAVGGAVVLTQLQSLFGRVPGGPWDEPPTQAFATGVERPGTEDARGILVLGLSSHLPFDRAYEDFCQLVAGHLTTAMSNADAREADRRRVEALAEIDRAKTAFFTNISHEFRTPLTLLLGPLDDLAGRGEGLGDDDRTRIDLARRSAGRLHRLVNALLEFSRIEAGRVQATFEPVDLAAVTRQVASMFESAFKRAGVAFTIETDPMPESVFVDWEMWERIVVNLVSNAFKHTYEGRVTVSVRHEPGAARLTVSDTGVGIPPDELPRLFERFHRIESPRARTHEGTGIGLALVQELVKLHGGTIEVASEVGVGSTFSVRIPLGSAHLPQDRLRSSSGRAATSPDARSFVDEALLWISEGGSTPDDSPAGRPADDGPELGRARILVVDDNADMRQYLASILSQDWTVETAVDGSEALSKIDDDPPDLVLADVMMPRLDGFGLVRRLRQTARTRTIPILLVSARAGDEAAAEGLAAGADDYLVKPFTTRDLRARVAAHLAVARLREGVIEELRSALESLQTNERELRAALQAKDDFLGMVSHELRTPLTTVLGNARLLATRGDRLTASALQDAINDILAEAERLSGVIDNLLVLARLDAGSRLEIEPVHVERLIDRVASAFRTRHPGRPIEVVTGSVPTLVNGHEGSLEQVLGNLLSNADKYSPFGALIRIELDSLDGESVVMVTDRGPGIDPSEAEALFRPFYRSSRTQAAPGLGIGLAVCRRLVEAQMGRLWVEPRSGPGATFAFALPRADGE